MRITIRICSLVQLLLFQLIACHNASGQTAEAPTEENLKVAFIGDQGFGSNAQAVLQLIDDEARNTTVPVSMVIHLGDFDYRNSPSDWESQIDGILGPDFPYFSAIGNHDLAAWDGYQPLIGARAARTPGAECGGNMGVKSACSYKGLFFILSGVGIAGSGHSSYIRDQLEESNAIWEVCGWHKNQTAMQIGGKPDDVGWFVYEECRKGGALVATGHEHSYSRTRTLTDIENQTIDPECPNPNSLCISAGESGARTFVFVSGLAGQSIRNQDRCLPSTFPYGCNGEWAMIYSSDQGATHGALFITFHVDGNPYKAVGEYKNILGETIDSFEIIKTPIAGGETELAAPENLRIDPE